MFPINLIIIELFLKLKPRPRKSARKRSFGSDDIQTMIESCGVNIQRIFKRNNIQSPTDYLTSIKEMQNYSNTRMFHDMFRKVKGFECGLDPNMIATEFVNTVDTFDWQLAGKAIGMNVKVDDTGSFSLSPHGAGNTAVTESSGPFGSLPPSVFNTDSKVCQHQGRVKDNEHGKPTATFSPEVEMMMPQKDMYGQLICLLFI